MNGTFLVFHNDSDDSYMNSSNNFRGADAGTEFVDMYFEAAAVGDNVSGTKGYDKVRLEVLAGKEEAVVEGLGAALAGAKNPVTIVADDVNSKYCHENIEGVTSITLNAVGSWLPITSSTAGTTLAAGDSGKVFFVNPGSTTAYTLPTITSALAGWNVKFIVTEGIDAVAGGMDNILNIHVGAGNDDFIGLILDASDGVGDYAVSGDDYINLTDTASPGDRIDIYCDGSRYYAYGVTNEAAQVLFNSAAAS